MLTNDPARSLPCSAAFSALATSPDRPRNVRVTNLPFLAAETIAMGHYREARDLLSTLEQLDPASASAGRLRLVASLREGGGIADALSIVITRNPQPDLLTLGLEGLAAIRLGRAGLLDSAVAGVLDIARREPIAEQYAAAVVASLRGLDALRRGDTAVALRILPGAYGVLPYNGSAEARFDDAVQWGVLGLAKLEYARGQPEQALGRLAFFTFATGPVPSRAEADSLRATIMRQPRP